MRSRNLKPSIFKNEHLAVDDPIYTVIFEGLWCIADREGRLEDKPAKIHMEINPGRAFETTERSLAWLAEKEFITRYSIGSARYIQVIKFSEHQNPHQKEPVSRIPKPETSTSLAPDIEPIKIDGKSETSPVLEPDKPGESISVAGLIPSSSDSPFLIPDSGILIAPVPDEPAPTGKSKRNGHKPPPKSLIPEDFLLTDERRAYAEKHLPDVDAEALMQTFRSTSKAKGWLYVDWEQHWQTLVRQWAPNSGHWSSSQYPRLGKLPPGTANGMEDYRW